MEGTLPRNQGWDVTRASCRIPLKSKSNGNQIKVNLWPGLELEFHIYQMLLEQWVLKCSLIWNSISTLAKFTCTCSNYHAQHLLFFVSTVCNCSTEHIQYFGCLSLTWLYLYPVVFFIKSIEIYMHFVGYNAIKL